MYEIKRIIDGKSYLLAYMSGATREAASFVARQYALAASGIEFWLYENGEPLAAYSYSA